MSDFPKVSVIVPVWNPGLGISRCVESLRGQTLEDIEMIFVDDCGTDGAMDAVRLAAAEDPRIYIITNAENMGAGASRNAAIEQARGEYLAFVDADDHIAPDFLEILYDKGHSANLDIVKGDIIYECEDGKIIPKIDNRNKKIQEQIDKGRPLFRFFNFEFQSAIYHSRLFSNPNVRFGLSAIGEDSVFLLKVCHVAGSFEIDERATYHYVGRKSSAICTITAKSLDDRLSTMRTLFDYADRFMPHGYHVNCYLVDKLKYYVAFQRYVSQMEGMEEAALRFKSELRALAKGYPGIMKAKEKHLTLLALIDYDECVAEWPYSLLWDVVQPEVYIDVITRQTEFLISHSQHYNFLESIEKRSELFLVRMKNEGIPKAEIESYKRQVKALWRHPAVIWMRIKYAVSRRREERCIQREQAELEKKQPILRQGFFGSTGGVPLKIDWEVTSFCNFRCTYCFDAGKEYKKDFCTLEQAETAIKHLASANRPSYQVSLLGGEPTTHPHLAEIITLLCQYLGDRLESLIIISNGSFGEKLMKTIIKEGEKYHFIKVIFSVHLDYMSIERVVELVKRLSNHIQLHIHLIFNPEWFEKAQIIAETLYELRKDYPFIIEVAMLKEPPRFDRFDSRYSQEHYAWAENAMLKFKEVAAEGAQWTKCYPTPLGWEFLVEKSVGDVVEKYERLSLSELKDLTGNVYTGMTCCAGTNVVKIEVDGRVRGMICGLDRPRYNIFDENPFSSEDWMHGVLCTKTMCGCSANYRIPKFRSPAEAQKFLEEKKLEQKKLMSEYQDNN